MTLPRSLRTRWQQQRANLPALAVILLFFLANFGPFIARGQFLIGGDSYFYTHPLRTTIWSMLRRGSTPLWMTSLMSGFPLLAMSQVALFYPLTWGYSFLPGHWAEEIFVLAPFLLMPLFTYAYVREIGRTRLASLIAALSFGYGGLTTNTYGMNGTPLNALMWLPLLLIVIERSRNKSLYRCLLLITLFYSLSISTGHAHSTMQIGVVAIGYSFIISLIGSSGNRNSFRPEIMKIGRWRPFLVTFAGMLSAIGVMAFQEMEPVQAAALSIRSSLTYNFFSTGALSAADSVRSFIAPLYHYTEVTTYQAPIFFLLAIFAVVQATRFSVGRDLRIYFWAVVVVAGLVFSLGGHTPVYKLLYHVPVFNKVRRPSRFVFEWTFGLSVLAAYGLDVVRSGMFPTTVRPSVRKVAALLALTGSIILGLLWWRAVRTGALETVYIAWKVAFTIATTLGIVCYAYSIPAKKNVALISLLLLVCFVEPFILIDHWWPGTAKTKERFQSPSLTTKWLQQYSATDQRVFVRLDGPDEETIAQPRFDARDRTALYGLQNVGGYEALFPERYSRALGYVEFDSFSPRENFPPSLAVYEPRSHVLDLLNAKFVVTWPELHSAQSSATQGSSGIRQSSANLDINLAPGKSVEFTVESNRGEALALVTSLANSVTVRQAEQVGLVRMFKNDGSVREHPLRAGIDTSEWAFDRTDVRSAIQHQRATLFEDIPQEGSNTFSAHRYWSIVNFGDEAPNERIQITNTSTVASLALWKLSIVDSASGASSPVTNEIDSLGKLDPSRWQVAAEMNGVFILQNNRAMPRAWLVNKAESVAGDEALKRITGVSQTTFDPQQTALLEVKPDEIPTLADAGPVTDPSSARLLSYEPNKIVFETDSTRSAILVVSEMFYPGWEATVDDHPSRVMLTDYLLRSVVVPAGRHRVEMSYTAASVRKGISISASVLILLLGIGLVRQKVEALIQPGV